MAAEDNLNAGLGATTAGLAGYAALGPVGWALGAAQLAGSLYGMKSQRRQRKRLKAELERRRVALIDSKNQAIGRIAEGTAASKAPLEAIAERVRTEEGFRDPVLEQSLATGAREQLGQQIRQTQAGQTSASGGIPQQQLLMAALLSQVQSSQLGRQYARRAASTQALTGIYSQLSQITQAGAQSASGIEMQYAGMMQQEPMLNGSPYDPAGDAIGGLLSYFQTDTGKEALGSLFSKFQGGGAGGKGVSYTFDKNGYAEF